MAIGTGDAVRHFSGSPITLEASGASINNANIGAADDATYDLTTSTYDDCAHARFYGSLAFASNPNNNGPVAIVIQALDVDGSSHNEADPTASFQPHRYGPILVYAQTATQYFEVFAHNLPRKGKVWLLNQAGQQISGWALYMDPFAYGPNA